MTSIKSRVKAKKKTSIVDFVELLAYEKHESTGLGRPSGIERWRDRLFWRREVLCCGRRGRRRSRSCACARANGCCPRASSTTAKRRAMPQCAKCKKFLFLLLL